MVERLLRKVNITHSFVGYATFPLSFHLMKRNKFVECPICKKSTKQILEVLSNSVSVSQVRIISAAGAQPNLDNSVSSAHPIEPTKRE